MLWNPTFLFSLGLRVVSGDDGNYFLKSHCVLGCTKAWKISGFSQIGELGVRKSDVFASSKAVGR